jgi:rhodanese-related sulfurtransferase/CBS domain-containing protein
MTDLPPKDILREDIRPLVRRGAQLVDVLPREEYDSIHISGAISIPLSMISRSTADRLRWDRPVIVYSRSCMCDWSARAAWRLSSLGFTQVFRYSGGKADWLANGLPVEGALARVSSAGDLADLDVPTCNLSERVGNIRDRVLKEGWNSCVVVNDQLVALGLLRGDDLNHADKQWTAEEAMVRDPQTYRLNASQDEVLEYFQTHRNIESVLITTTDGKLFGLLKREDIEKT